MLGAAEGLQLMTEGVGEGQKKSVVRLPLEVVALSHLEAGSVAQHEEGNVVVSVGVALSEFVGPNDGGVIKHGSRQGTKKLSSMFRITRGV